MKKVISLLEMGVADVNSEYLGVPRQWLMENAGNAVSNVLREFISGKTCLLILAGTGGNGGDGMVAARHLAGETKVTLLLLGDPSKIRATHTLNNWRTLQRMTSSITLHIITCPGDIPKGLFEGNPVILDAILGTGIQGELREPIKSCVELANQAKSQGSSIIAVDVPSGIDPGTGNTTETFIQADVTVSLHATKEGILKADCGKIETRGIGMPPEAETMAGPGDLLAIRKRDRWTYKGKNGVVLIIGGSKDYSGAPGLCAMGALRSGVDLAITLTSESVVGALRSYSPEIIARSFEEDYFQVEAVPQAINLAEKSDVVLLGSGLGFNAEVEEGVKEFLKRLTEIQRPVVIDADALKCLEGVPLPNKTVLTPHAGEFKIITGIDLPTGPTRIQERIEVIQEEAGKLRATLLAKGPWDVISDGEKWKINKTGTPEMSVGGTGDVLAGITAGFLSRCEDPFRAAVAGAFISGISGQMVTNEIAHFSAVEMAKRVSKAIKESKKFIQGIPNKVPQPLD